MVRKNIRLAGGALLAFMTLVTADARAGVDDYAFELVSPKARLGQGFVDMRLIRKADGKSVPDAVIFATRLDMAPDDMEAMTSAIEPAATPKPGVYRFKVDLTDEGRWRISIAAKLQGETGTLQSRLILQVAP